MLSMFYVGRVSGAASWRFKRAAVTTATRIGARWTASAAIDPQRAKSSVAPYSVTVDWKSGSRSQFVGRDDRGNEIIMAGTETEGGLSPMRTLLAALAGCSAVDLVGILRKQKQQVTGVSIRVEGQRAAEWPKEFESIHVVYEVTGASLSGDKVRDAAKLAISRYCGVHETLEKGVRITWASEIKDPL